LLHGEDDDENDISRPYTPISRVDETGMVRFVIKVYRPNKRFPKGGLMSQYLANLKVGDKLFMSGPVGKCKYLGNGRFYKIPQKKLMFAKKITFIAGGTGITPFYQLLQHINDNNEKTRNNLKVKLLFANKSSKDILLRKELTQMAANKTIDDLKFCLDKVDEEGWEGFEGFVNQKMLSGFLWENTNDHIVLMCGPPLMCNDIMDALDEMKYENYIQY
jgi:NAD(P)H-flavin reductase